MITHLSDVNTLTAEAIALIIMERTNGTVNWYLREVRSAEAEQLCIYIREKYTF